MRREARRLAYLTRLNNERAIKGDDVGRRWTFYAASQAPAQLTGWTRQLEEFALKAIARRDIEAANAAVATLGAIGTKYAESRRDSMVLRPDLSGPMPIAGSDVNDVLNPIYESLKNVCEDGIRQPNEAVVIACLRTIGRMADHALTMVHVQDGRWKTVPLAHAPVFYLDLCTKKAITAGMDDALLTTIRATGPIFGRISVDVSAAEVEATALECLFSIALTSYPRQAVVPCFAAVEMMLRAAKCELVVRGFDTGSILRDVLRKLAQLVPFEAAMDKGGQRVIQTFPAYYKGFDANVSTLLEEAAKRIEPVDPTRSWIDPFAEFAEVSEVVVHHYRDAVKKTTFDGVLLEKWMMDSLIAGAGLHVELLEDSPPESEPFLETVDKRLGWFISAPTFFFGDGTAFPFHHAAEAVGGLAILGMRLLKLSWSESALDCGKTIAYIAQKSAKTDKPKPYSTADILVKLEQLARAADAVGRQPLASQLRDLLTKVVSESTLQGLDDAMRERLASLDEALRKSWNRDIAMPHDPMPLLRRTLAEARLRGLKGEEPE